MSAIISSLPLNDRVARLYDLTTKSYRQRITPDIKETIIRTLAEVNPSITVDFSQDDLDHIFSVVAKQFGEYMSNNNIPEQLFHAEETN